MNQTKQSLDKTMKETSSRHSEIRESEKIPSPATGHPDMMYRELFHIIPEGIMVLDAATGQIVDVNKGLADMLQCGREAFLSQKVNKVLSMEDLSQFHETVRELKTKKHVYHPHVPIQTKEGNHLDVSFDCRLFTANGKDFIRCEIRKAGDMQQSASVPPETTALEDAFVGHDEVYRLAFSSTSDVIFMVDKKLHITSMTPSVECILGYAPGEFINRRIDELPVFSAAYQASAITHLLKVFKGETVSNAIYEFIAKDGTIKYGEVTASPMRKDGNIMGVIAIARDTTERHRTEEDLRKKENFLRRSQEVAKLGSYEFDVRSGVWSSSPVLDHIFGIDAGYAKDIDGWLDIIHPDDYDEMKHYLLDDVLKNNISFAKEYRIVRKKDAETRWVYGLGELVSDGEGNLVMMIGTIQDITERKQMEADILKNELRYRTIVENSQEGIFQSSPHSRQVTLNRAFATMLGYESTEEAEKDITNIPRQVYVNTEEYQKVLDMIRQEGGVKGFETEFYRKDKSKIWINMSVSAVRDASGELLYYHGIVEDITPKKRLEQERQESINRLRKSLGATINAMSATVEARDPYTAGHQRRVADLARAIATEMKLSKDQIDGIRLAGMIHDIGKISVPSEILTKPTRLTALEFELIKTHSEAGFNILKDIEFPWPIARIVLEHHERVNGTGYPQGLKGEEILLESRIIAVADVIEAISSNRPYRPAFGIAPALEELTKNAGTLYDKDASEACLRLFRENRYKMPF